MLIHFYLKGGQDLHTDSYGTVDNTFPRSAAGQTIRQITRDVANKTS